MNEFDAVTLVKRARVLHRCVESRCKRGRPGPLGGIKPGESYYRWAGVTDGDFWSVVLCVRCKRLHETTWRRYRPDYAEEGIEWGGLFNYIREARRNCAPFTWDRKTKRASPRRRTG